LAKHQRLFGKIQSWWSSAIFLPVYFFPKKKDLPLKHDNYIAKLILENITDKTLVNLQKILVHSASGQDLEVLQLHPTWKERASTIIEWDKIFSMISWCTSHLIQKFP
jgi:hypothetical protein